MEVLVLLALTLLAGGSAVVLLDRRARRRRAMIETFAKDTGGRLRTDVSASATYQIEYAHPGLRTVLVETDTAATKTADLRTDYVAAVDGRNPRGLMLRIVERPRGMQGLLGADPEDRPALPPPKEARFLLPGARAAESGGEAPPSAELQLASWTSGDEAFDGRFAVATNQADEAGSVLDGDTRGGLEKLFAALGSLRPVLRLDQSLLSLQLDGTLDRREGFDALLSLADPLFGKILDRLGPADRSAQDAAPAVDPTGIEIVPGPPDPTREIQCPVCGEAISGACVHCAQCGAPHHGDCWLFNGRCAVFACGSTRARRAARSS